MFWLIFGLLVVLVAAIYAVSTRGGGRWSFIPFVNQRRNDLAQEEYLAEIELDRMAEQQKAKDVAP